MEKFSIEGPSKIRGEIKISGSKNSSLPILAATLLFNKPVIIKNLPKVKDINTMISLLRSLGSKVILSKDRRIAKIYNKKKIKTFASYSLVKTMRGSILVLGPLVAKYFQSKISLPGGCLIGARPINYHLDALKKLGMDYILKDGYILAKSKGKLKGATIKFPKILMSPGRMHPPSANNALTIAFKFSKAVLSNAKLAPSNVSTCSCEGLSSFVSSEYTIYNHMLNIIEFKFTYLENCFGIVLVK